MDIRFYDLNFNLLYILPSNSLFNGYISCNTTQDYNGHGSFEVLFISEELERITKEYRDNMLMCWNSFQGFLTGYKFDENSKTLYGQHLNGLLSRRIVKKEYDVLKGTVEESAKYLIGKYYDFLSFGENIGSQNVVEFEVENYRPGDEIIKALLDKDKAGYEIVADIPQKKYIFKVCKSEENPLMISENNLNAYDFSESYDNKDLITCGWYKKETDESTEGEMWECIYSDEDKSGIYKKEVCLSADTENKAKTELEEFVPHNQVLYKTRNIEYLKDYKLGDIIRCQRNQTTIKKQITSVNRWFEKEKGEQPILSEI